MPLMISMPFNCACFQTAFFVYNSFAFDAKSARSSAIKPFQGKLSAIPSTPIEVVTLGVPQSIASVNFPLIPAPKFKGAKTTFAFSTTSFASSAKPLTIKPSFLSFNS